MTATAQANMIPEGKDLWFSSSGALLTFGESGFRFLRRGAVLSTSGEVVFSNRDLLSEFEPRMFAPLGRGLDALSITGSMDDPTVYFSVERPFYSNKLGRRIGNGDLLNNRGELVATNADLLAAFDPQGPLIGQPNFGLDAVAVRGLADGDALPEIWFSTSRSFYSKALGKHISDGDILSTSGEIIARYGDLLAAFEPRRGSYGLDSFLVVDNEDGSRTFWFSTEKKFYSQALGREVLESDLLSSDGQIIMAESEFFSIFGRPLVGCFGIDAGVLVPPDVPPSPKPRPDPPPVPEPASLLLLAVGVAVGLRRRAVPAA